MGIHGLMTYVGENHQFFNDLKLKNTKIIIDGNNLYHRLYFDSGLDLQHGGDYDSFTDVVHKFFESLAVCNIQPYVVLDGGCDFTDKKLETLKQRGRDRIQAAHSISRGGGGSVLPLLSREVFKQILNKSQVPFVQCFSEADRDIVTLANQWCCPVLTLDSDFCIFDLKAGYCPLNYFQWRNICTSKETSDCYIPARCFSIDKFCSHFSNMNKSLLPLFAVLNGNDYINLPALETFFSRVRFPIGVHSLSGRKHIRIQGLLNWLANFTDPKEAIENVVKYLPKHDRENIKELLHSSMEEYQQSDVSLEDFFQNGSLVSQIGMELGIFPEWALVALAKGQLAPFISDAVVLKRTILHVQVENMQRSSCHMSSLPIRQVIYGLLLSTNQEPSLSQSPTKASNKIFNITEFDRFHKTLKVSSVQAAVLTEFSCQENPIWDRLPRVSSSERLRLLLETLQVKDDVIESVPAELKLPIAVTCHWLNHSDPGVKLQHLQALLLGVVYGELCSLMCNSESHTDDIRMAYNQLFKLKTRKQQKGALDIDLAHIFCQWQCCLQMGFYLNQLLRTPLTEPDLTRLYSGTLVHQIYRELKLVTSAEDLLSGSLKACQLYQDLLGAVGSSIPPDFFQKKSKSRPCKKKKQVRLAESSDRSQLEAQPGCDVSNRFEALLGEDLNQ
ncbi:protein asteroid homolog 1 [Latimeria chalumnae]|uniref:protein asteroid homolog 1 n=1 Tax=Latimeria chalumnae TaxID=7897 RepID=UPI0003C19699|nr:PREDICTED: protein asteroid homolog 1 [Latimeria chalumnae]XP_006004260.1 PREDICTED: protein asteroid homolog 1 [Latimeria chalumnae]XP_006004261.1 PREDICTED: protein asteroid homolog 1 [Latimeria chalumnae]|eukprot:XP_006004259.1 PREDICTED: protein asteroid homolog 1 [Latimeria chalumnae]